MNFILTRGVDRGDANTGVTICIKIDEFCITNDYVRI